MAACRTLRWGQAARSAVYYSQKSAFIYSRASTTVWSRRWQSIDTSPAEHAATEPHNTFAQPEATPVEPSFVPHTAYSQRDEVINKFITCLMQDGRKQAATKVLENAFVDIKRTMLAKERAAALKSGTAIITPSGPISTLPYCDPVTVFYKAIENTQPTIALTPVKKSGSIVQVPTPLTDKRRLSLAMKWIITAARKRKTRLMPQALAAELVDASNNQGAAIRKRIEVHKMAEANRAFASMRWS